MSYFYPQAAVVLRVTFEDFEDKNADTKDLKALHTLNVLARRIEVNVNDYTQADTFSIEIDYKQFPFDPRCIRSCGVSIHLEDMKKLYDTTGAPTRIVPTSNQTNDNTIFLGFADEESISFDDDHRTVRMEGRDYTALMLDLKFPAKELSLTQPLDQLIAGFLKANEATTEIKVDNRTGTSPLPAIAQFAPGFTAQTSKKNPKANESLWDLLQELVSRAGLICYMEIDTLVITKPRVLYGRKDTVQFIYGQNLKTLEFKRKLGRKKGFNIRAASLNVMTKQVEEAKIPLEATLAWSDDVGISQEEISIPQYNADGSRGDDKVAPYIAFNFPNMVKKQLIEVGQKIFEEVGRQQIEGSFTTKDMLIPQRDGTKDGFPFDVTDMRNGTPIEIHVDQGDLKGIQALDSESSKVRFLQMRGYDAPVARALAETLGKFHPRFYIKSIQLSLEEESGFQMKVDFINFIELDNKGIGDGAGN